MPKVFGSPRSLEMETTHRVSRKPLGLNSGSFSFFFLSLSFYGCFPNNVRGSYGSQGRAGQGQILPLAVPGPHLPTKMYTHSAYRPVISSPAPLEPPLPLLHVVCSACPPETGSGTPAPPRLFFLSRLKHLLFPNTQAYSSIIKSRCEQVGLPKVRFHLPLPVELNVEQCGVSHSFSVEVWKLAIISPKTSTGL